MDVRPTPDRLRETLFDVLAPRIAGCRVFVDAYAGTGAVGIEALSRGAERAIFLERGRKAVETIRANLASLGLAGRAEVHHGKAAPLLERLAAGIVFLDPPYRLEGEYPLALATLGDLAAAELVIVQHSSRFQLAERYGRLCQVRTLKQGDNELSFYSPSP